MVLGERRRVETVVIVGTRTRVAVVMVNGSLAIRRYYAAAVTLPIGGRIKFPYVRHSVRPSVRLSRAFDLFEIGKPQKLELQIWWTRRWIRVTERAN